MTPIIWLKHLRVGNDPSLNIIIIINTDMLESGNCCIEKYADNIN